MLTGFEKNSQSSNTLMISLFDLLPVRFHYCLLMIENSEYPAVSIIIPVFNREEAVRCCLKSLKQLDYPEQQMEIIVVDNGSSDRTIDVVREFNVSILEETTRGAAAARNRGVKEANHPLIVFIDSDCEAKPNWLKNLVQPFNEPGICGAGGRLLDNPNANIYERYFEERVFPTQEKAMQGSGWFQPFIITANCAFRLDWLNKVNGFDESFSIAAEDADLSWRMKALGGEFVYQSNAEVTHYHQSSSKNLMQTCYNYGIGTVHLFKKHKKDLEINFLFSTAMYRMALSSLIKTPIKYFLGKTEYERKVAWLDFKHALMHLAAKWITSIKLGIICL